MIERARPWRPFFVPTEILIEAMTAATGQSWDAIESQAHWGSWAVLRPASPDSVLRAAGSTTELHEAHA